MKKRLTSQRRLLGVCATFLALGFLGTAQAASPVGYWNLNEGTGSTAADSSGSGNTGTLVNSPSWTAGKIGDGLNFILGTNSYVAVPGSKSLANLYTSGMTLTAWINPRSAGQDGRGRIVDKDNNNVGWFLSMASASSIAFNVDEYPDVNPSRTSTAVIKLNTWQHVAVTWDGSITGANIHIYVNGVLADGASLVGSGSPGDDTLTPLSIGNRASDLARSFDGVLDEVRLYNGVLTVSQIQALANTQAPTAPATLTATRVSATQANLSWAASSGPFGIASYLIERCAGASCSSFAQVATSTTASYSDTGLTASTAYSYRVRATDAASNLGPYSPVASVAPSSSGGTPPPSVPTGLTASNVTASSFTLSWTASSDTGGPGTGGYFVYLNGNTTTPVATVNTGTSYSASGLSSSTTYSYQVAAFDTSSPANVSAPSTPLSVTTLSSSSTWSGGEIGGASGSYSSSGGTFTVASSGVDLWGTSDQFEFVSQPFTGDGSITARVVSQTVTDPWAKAGVMFRETLTGGSRFAAVAVTPGNGAIIEGRTATGGADTSVHGPLVKAPYWVRMVRSGTTLTGYISPDGVTWTSIGQYTVQMASQVFVGIAVTSHTNSAVSTAVVDNVSVGGPSTPQLTVTPSSASLVTGATQQYTANFINTPSTTVTWQVNSVSGGATSTGTISSSGLYTAPGSITASPTTYTITAVASGLTGSATAIVSAPATGGVDVTTYKNDLARTGQNLRETILTPANVRSATFGLLRVLPADGEVFAQPLYLSALSVAGSVHNVLFVATENNSVYAYDADSGAKLWQSTLTPSGETASDDRSCGQISPVIGVTATPVIDRAAGPHGAIFLVAMTKDSSGGYHQRLHALDVTTGTELFSGPSEITATYPTATGGTTTFDPSQYKDRAGLLLLNGQIYTTWASHCDNLPYAGWIISFSESTLARTHILNVGPNSNNQGPAIWMAGDAPSADSSNNIYLLTGNGTFDTTLDTNGFPSAQDYGNAFLKLSTANNALTVADYFTMSSTVNESTQDLDLGASGAMLLPDVTDATGTVRHLVVGGGKDGNIYVVNRDSMGKFNATTNNIWQELDGANSQQARTTPAYFNGWVYYSERYGSMKAWAISAAKLSASPTSQTPNAFGYPGGVPVISANGTSNAIVWAADASNSTLPNNVLYAYDATNLANELYNSTQAASGRDNFGTLNRFTAPTVANGKLFLSTTTGVAVFGLLGP